MVERGVPTQPPAINRKTRNVLVFSIAFLGCLGLLYGHSMTKEAPSFFIQDSFAKTLNWNAKEDLSRPSIEDYIFPNSSSTKCPNGLMQIGGVHVCNLSIQNSRGRNKNCNVVSLWSPTSASLYFVRDAVNKTTCTVDLFTSVADTPFISSNPRFKMIEIGKLEGPLDNWQLQKVENYLSSHSAIDIFQAEVTASQLQKLAGTLKSLSLKVTQLALSVRLKRRSDALLSPYEALSQLLGMGFTVIHSEFKLGEQYLQVHVTFYNYNSESGGVRGTGGNQSFLESTKTLSQNNSVYNVPARTEGIAMWEALAPVVTCPKNYLQHVGSNGDGGKWVCALETMPKDCVVYSFGVNGDSSFEADILAKSKCSTYSFDPGDTRIGYPLDPNNPRAIFKQLAIVGKEKPSDPTKKTLKSIMKEFGHTFIHILKMDIEQGEYDVLENILEDFEEFPVGQMNVEFHIWDWKKQSEFVRRLLSLFNNLRMQGMLVYHSERNPAFPKLCWEYSFLNIRYHKY